MGLVVLMKKEKSVMLELLTNTILFESSSKLLYANCAAFFVVSKMLPKALVSSTLNHEPIWAWVFIEWLMA